MIAVTKGLVKHFYRLFSIVPRMILLFTNDSRIKALFLLLES